MSGAAVFLSALVFFALLWCVGFSYLVRNARGLAAVVLLCSVGLCWWAIHYVIELSRLPELTADLQWHRIYMICVLILIPASLVVGGILGLVRQQRDYLARYDVNKVHGEPPRT